MKLKRFKESDKKKMGIIVFTVTCIMLISGVILYRTFAIFETNDEFNVINGTIEDEGNIRFMVYVDNELQKSVPDKDSGYSLDTSESYCENGSIVSWNDEKWSVEIKGVSTTKTKCYLYFKQIYQEEILHGAIPDLGNGRLIPVTISDSERPSDITYTGAQAGKVKKADITTKWYSYIDKQWANTVILKDGVTDHYTPGEEIPESEIESYFVWIPRYKYKLKNSESEFNKFINVENVGNVESVSAFYEKRPNQATSNAFEIEFETKDKGRQSGTTKDSYLTHPAFTSFDVNGMWVGKFETGYNQNSSNDNVTPTENWSIVGANKNEIKSDKIIIKPNVYSWRSIQVANAFYTSYNYQRELESHMMKNSEWGAVAYLTQSKYGRCTEKDGSTTCDKINRNNSSSSITGMSTTETATCGYTGTNESCNYYGGPRSLSSLESENIKSYYLKESQGGSTTGNYYGIYDMAGGAWEYVMGVMQGANDSSKAPASGRNELYNSGFNGKFTCPTCDDLGSGAATELLNGQPWPSSKYYDLYDYNTSNQYYQRGHLGDGTKEYGPFYSVGWKKSDGSYITRYVNSYNTGGSSFVCSDYPWFLRGGYLFGGSETGVETFIYAEGRAYSMSFRIVLMPY